MMQLIAAVCRHTGVLAGVRPTVRQRVDISGLFNVSSFTGSSAPKDCNLQGVQDEITGRCTYSKLLIALNAAMEAYGS
jgi:hypothetical protein